MGSHEGLGACGAIPIERWSLLVMAIPVTVGADVGGTVFVVVSSTGMICVSSRLKIFSLRVVRMDVSPMMI